MKSRLLTLLRYLPLAASVIFVIIYFCSGEPVTIEEILDYAPENHLLAALFLIFFYTVKSLAVFFPIIVLYIAGGCMFDAPIALLVNTIGFTCGILLEYFIGRVSGRSAADRLLAKHPRAAVYLGAKHENDFFVSFFLRIISLLPCDLVSLYLGAINVPLYKFLLGSLAGALPGLAAATLVGTSITDPASPVFIVSVILTVLLTLFSGAGYIIFIKKKRPGKTLDETELFK